MVKNYHEAVLATIQDHRATVGERTTASEDIRVGGVNDDGPDVICVRLERVHLLQRVVVENSDLHVVGTSHHPALANNKLSCSNWR